MYGWLIASLLFFLIIFLIYYIVKLKHKSYDELYKQYNNKLLKDFNEKLKKLSELNNNFLLKQNDFQHLLEEINEKKQFNQDLYKIRQDELDKLIEEKKKVELEKLEKEIEEWASSAQEAANFNSNLIQSNLDEKIDKRKEELDGLITIINDYKARRDTINEEILRSRAIEEQRDFYRIQLPESSKHDLQILQSIRKEITKIDILDKLIYDNYIKKSVDEMTKRVLKGENPSGIYKITRLKTGEIYIGKSVNIKDRWVQHSKSCYHCGTISHSTLHTIMEKDNIENFTWELLEEVPKDKLGEREKYWIQFYDSKNFGLNERNGG